MGAVLGLAVTLVIDRLASGDQSIWWAPAGTVTGLFAGAVLGVLFAAELEGDPDE
jgi:hypothetical protein